MSQAEKVCSDMLGFDDVVRHAVENAEAHRIAAAKRLVGLSTGSVELADAAGSLKEAEKEALDAHAMAAEAAAHALNATNAVAAMQRLAGEVIESRADQTGKLISRIQKLGAECAREAAATRRLTEALKKKWLSLSVEALSAAGATNSAATAVSNGIPSYGGP